MPPPSSLFVFIAALFVMEITPGPDMMLVVARGIGQGRRIAILTVIGMIFVAGTVQVSLLVLGVASLLEAHPTSLLALQWAGATYMLYLGIRMIMASFGRAQNKHLAMRTISDWAAIRQGTINNLTNPKSILFMFAFLPQFVDPAAGPIWLQLLVLGMIQKLSGILSLGSVAGASGTVGHWLSRRPGFLKWQQRFTGMVMVGLAVRLLWSGHPAPAAASRP